MLEDGHNYCDRCGKEIPVNESNPLLSDTLCDDCSKYLDEQISRLRNKKNEDSNNNVSHDGKSSNGVE